MKRRVRVGSWCVFFRLERCHLWAVFWFLGDICRLVLRGCCCVEEGVVESCVAPWAFHLLRWRKMALRSNRILRKYTPYYSRVRVTEGSDSDVAMRSSGSYLSSSFTWFHRAFSNGSAHTRVPLSESPKRELRMRSTTKVGRQHGQSQKLKKHISKLWW